MPDKELYRLKVICSPRVVSVAPMGSACPGLTLPEYNDFCSCWFDAGGGGGGGIQRQRDMAAGYPSAVRVSYAIDPTARRPRDCMRQQLARSQPQPRLPMLCPRRGICEGLGEGQSA